MTQEDFEEALDSILLGTRQPGLTNVDERRLVAYHEGGHAIVGAPHSRAPIPCTGSRSCRTAARWA